MTGLVVGAPQTFRYFNRIQEQIVDFVTLFRRTLADAALRRNLRRAQ